MIRFTVLPLDPTFLNSMVRNSHKYDRQEKYKIQPLFTMTPIAEIEAQSSTFRRYSTNTKLQAESRLAQNPDES